MEAMGASAAQHPDKLLFSAMAAGFKELCYDGKPFFSEQHKNGGYSYSNKGTEKLSAESYQAARSQMMSILSDNGTPLGIVPDLLVVPPALEHTARLILKADQINGTDQCNERYSRDPCMPGTCTGFKSLVSVCNQPVPEAICISGTQKIPVYFTGKTGRSECISER